MKQFKEGEFPAFWMKVENTNQRDSAKAILESVGYTSTTWESRPNDNEQLVICAGENGRFGFFERLPRGVKIDSRLSMQDLIEHNFPMIKPKLSLGGYPVVLKADWSGHVAAEIEGKTYTQTLVQSIAEDIESLQLASQKTVVLMVGCAEISLAEITNLEQAMHRYAVRKNL